MNIIVNGEYREVTPTTTVAEIVRSLTDAPSGVAVAVNDEVVPRAGWEAAQIAENDRVDVLTAVQGG